MTSETPKHESNGEGRGWPGVAGYVAFPLVTLLCLIAAWQALDPGSSPYVDLRTGEASGDTPHTPDNEGDSLRFAVATMWSVQSTFSLYHDLVQRIARDTGRHDSFVLRPSYAELGRALAAGEVDVAVVCTGPYIHMFEQGTARLLVQPEFVPGLLYRTVVTVPNDSPVTEFGGLSGKSIAFSDRESFTGCLVPSLNVLNCGDTPKTFFRKIVFTGSHEESVRALDQGLVDAAAVHSIVWSSIIRTEPALAERLRVVWQSQTYGPPPVVVPVTIEAALEEKLLDAFLKLHTDDEGAGILRQLGIQRFVKARPEDYQTAIDVQRRLRNEAESMP